MINLTTQQLREIERIKNPFEAIQAVSKFSPQHKKFVEIALKEGYKPAEILDYIKSKPLIYTHVLEGLTHTVSRVPQIYTKEIEESRRMMRGRGDTGLPSIIERPLGLLRYLYSPVQSILRAFVGEPVSQSLKQVGVPPKVAETAGTMAEVAADVIVPAKAAKAISKKFEKLSQIEKMKKEAELIKQSAPTVPMDPEKEPAFRLASSKLRQLFFLNKEQRKLIAKQKAERFKAFGEALEEADTFEDAGKAFAALKGEYESLRKLHPSLKDALFSADEVEVLFNIVRDSKLKEGTKISALRGLYKSLQGILPYESELKALGAAFSPQFARFLNMYGKTMEQSRMSLAKRVFLEAVNIPRTIKASCDMSGMLRQGVFFVGRHTFWKDVSAYFKGFFSQKNYAHIMKSIRNDPLFEKALKYKLDLTEAAGELGLREEVFLSDAIRKIPVFGRIVDASERGYVAFLNKLRFDTFKIGYNHLTKVIKDQEELANAIKGWATIVNNATGRGKIPMPEVGTLIHSVMFAPKLFFGRLYTLRDIFTGFSRYHPEVRKMAIKDAIGFGSFLTTGLSLAALAGANIGLDPRSADFLKMKIGDTRIDISGGITYYVRLPVVLLSETMISSIDEQQHKLGGGFGSYDSIDVIRTFLQSKLSPLFYYMVDLLTGKDFTGKNLDLAVATARLFIPMFVEDVMDMVDREAPPQQWIPAVTGAWFGAGAQIYGINDHIEYHNKEIKKAVDVKMAELGIRLPMQFTTFRGYELSGKEVEMWIDKFSDYAYPVLYKALQSEKFQKLSVIDQRDEIGNLVKKIKTATAITLFGIPESHVRRLVKHAEKIVERKLLMERPDLDRKKLRALIEKESEKAVQQHLRRYIEERRQYREWLESLR